MKNQETTINLSEDCTFVRLSQSNINKFSSFDCGNDDLNDFFKNDAINYSDELIGKTHFFVLDNDPSKVVCAFTVSNDTIKVFDLPNSRRKKVGEQLPSSKRRFMKFFPAVKIGRLGVDKDFRGKGIGRQLMNFIKVWFYSIDNKTGCRFVVVDAYNESGPIAYYEKNEFKGLFSSEEQEILYLYNTGYFQEKEGQDRISKLDTRVMYYDLKLLQSE